MQKLKQENQKYLAKISNLVGILLGIALILSVLNADAQEAEATYKNTQEYKDYQQAKADLEEAQQIYDAQEYHNEGIYQMLKDKEKAVKRAQKQYKKTKEYKAFITKTFIRLEGGYGTSTSSDSFIDWSSISTSSLFGRKSQSQSNKSTKHSLYYANIEFGSFKNNKIVKPHYYMGLQFLQAINTKDKFQAQYIAVNGGLDLYIGKRLSAIIGANVGVVYAQRTKIQATDKITGVGYTLAGKLGVAYSINNRIGLELGTKLGYIYLGYSNKNGGSYNMSAIDGRSSTSYISGYGAIKFSW